MPIYEYECSACGHRFELIQKVGDRQVRTCPECKARKVKRLIHAPAIQFKGEGWYVTDYSDQRRKDKKAAEGRSEGGDSADKADKADKAGRSDKSDKADKSNKKAATESKSKSDSSKK